MKYFKTLLLIAIAMTPFVIATESVSGSLRSVAPQETEEVEQRELGNKGKGKGKKSKASKTKGKGKGKGKGKKDRDKEDTKDKGREEDPEDALTAEVIREWSQLLLDMIAASFGFLSPPGVGRALAMITSAEWNAVAPYTTDTIPVVMSKYAQDASDSTFQRYDRHEPTVREAVSVASFLTIAEIFDPTVPCLGAAAREKALPIFEERGLELLKEYVHVPAHSVDEAVHYLYDKATGASARAVESTRILLHDRRNDGMNSRGDLSINGVCYDDYTLYASANPPQTEVSTADCDAIRYLGKWQQLRVPTADGGSRLRPWLAPYMARVIPFAFETKSLWLDLAPPPNDDNPEFFAQHTEVLEIYGRLDDRDKTIAEYWADGPRSTLPPGHWHDIALVQSERRELGSDDTLRLLFIQSQAVFDAGIGSWGAKRFYDSARPLTAIQCLYEGQHIKSWIGPYKGVGIKDASDWIPYQDEKFVTPPFGEFVSGHSTFSTASAVVIKAFLGTDEYGDSVTVKEGESTFERKIDDPSDPNYVAGVTDVPNTGPESVGYVPREDVTLTWDTFSQAADEAGDSRLVGGIHIAAGNNGGKELGTAIGNAVVEQYQRLIV